MDPVICVRKNSRYVEIKHNGGIESRRVRIQVSGRIFDKFEEGIWWKRRGVGKGSRVEEIRARRENHGRVCTGIQESSKGSEYKG